MTELAQAVVNGLQMGFLYALVAVGLTIIWGLMEMINFAHGEFLMLGMFAAWWPHADLGLDPLLAIVPIGLVMYVVRRAGLPATSCGACRAATRSRRSSPPSACSSCCRMPWSPAFTSDYRFVNDSFLARLGGAKLTLLRRHARVPLLLAAGLALAASSSRSIC